MIISRARRPLSMMSGMHKVRFPLSFKNTSPLLTSKFLYADGSFRTNAKNLSSPKRPLMLRCMSVVGSPRVISSGNVTGSSISISSADCSMLNTSGTSFSDGSAFSDGWVVNPADSPSSGSVRSGSFRTTLLAFGKAFLAVDAPRVIAPSEIELPVYRGDVTRLRRIFEGAFSLSSHIFTNGSNCTLRFVTVNA